MGVCLLLMAKVRKNEERDGDKDGEERRRRVRATPESSLIANYSAVIIFC